MDAETAIKGILDAEHKLQSAPALRDRTVLSEQMMRLSSYTVALEEHLAKIEKEYEDMQGGLLKKYLIEENIAVTKAEKLVKIELSELKSKLVYATRLVGSAWKQTSIIQSRIKHLEAEYQQGGNTV